MKSGIYYGMLSFYFLLGSKQVEYRHIYSAGELKQERLNVSGSWQVFSEEVVS